MSRRSSRRLAAVACALALAGCAGLPPAGDAPPSSPAAPPSAPPIPRNVEPPPPPVNLSGFPLPYRQGYADGCASATGAQRRDATRYSADGNYRTGWTDGLATCKKK